MINTSGSKTVTCFIDYLRDVGVIDAGKAENLHMLEQTRLKFGIIALRESHISAEQLQIVLEEQAMNGNGSGEVKIGELMVNRGFMTEDQVEKTLLIQNRERDLPAEMLVDTGILPSDILREELEKFLLI